MTEIHSLLHDGAVVPAFNGVSQVCWSHICSGFVIFGEAAFYLVAAVKAMNLPSKQSAACCLSQDHINSDTCRFCIFLFNIQALMLKWERKLLGIPSSVFEVRCQLGGLRVGLRDRYSAG
jgi:hypothetical protein